MYALLSIVVLALTVTPCVVVAETKKFYDLNNARTFSGSVSKPHTPKQFMSLRGDHGVTVVNSRLNVTKAGNGPRVISNIAPSKEAFIDPALPAASAEDLEEIARDLGLPASAVAQIDHFIWPLPDGEQSLTSRFGYRADPVSGERAFHAGIDIRAPAGSNVLAADAGTVIDVALGGGLGRSLKIRHPDGSATVYGHLRDMTVSEGQQVSSGQIIGHVGMTGRTTGPHLHFGVEQNGTSIDPLSRLDLKKKAPPSLLASLLEPASDGPAGH